MTSVPGVAPERPASNRAAQWPAAAALMAPSGFLLIVFLVLPFLMAFGLSFTNQRLIPRPVPTVFVGLANYLDILDDADFWRAFWNTARFALVVVPVQTALALALAVLVNEPLRGRAVFRTIYFLPVVLSSVVITVMWGSLLSAPSGVLNGVVRIASAGTLGPFDWLTRPELAMPVIIVISIWSHVGFQMIVYLAGLQGIPSDLYEAARIDGATPWQRFRYVTMPALRNTHVFVLVVTTISAFKLFTQVHLLTKGGPLGSTNTLVRYIYSAGFSEMKAGYASAGAVIFLMIVLAISLAQRRVLARGEPG